MRLLKKARMREISYDPPTSGIGDRRREVIHLNALRVPQISSGLSIEQSPRCNPSRARILRMRMRVELVRPRASRGVRGREMDHKDLHSFSLALISSRTLALFYPFLFAVGCIG